MNALTSKIWTAYPAASMNQKDFYNLLGIYLDATLYPLLRKESFHQEASRLEFDEDGQLEYKGVVFNEMKGSLASPYSRLFKEIARSLYGKTPYGSDSGGDPKNIVDLTHEDLISFHEKYYHPSRCLYYFYGNIPTKKHLDFLDEKVFCTLLTKKNAIAPLETIASFAEPKQYECAYPGTKIEGQKQDFITFNWVMMDIDAQDDLLTLTLLDTMLMQTDASPLKKELIASGYCQNIDSMLDTDTKQIPYILIASGCHHTDKALFKEKLFDTLKKLANMKFDQHLIEASLSTLEMERTEIASGSTPYGLTLFYRSILPYMQGASYSQPLQSHTLFQRLAEKLKKPDYLQNFINKYFLENKHFSCLSMKLDEQMQTREELEEKQKLSAIKKLLSSEKIKEIHAIAGTLKKEQEQKDDAEKDLLPGLCLSDIEKEVPYFPLSHTRLNSFDAYHHACFCNNFVYLDITLPLANISLEKFHALKLLVSFITEVGSKKTPYTKRLIAIQNTFSDLSCSLHLNMQKDHLESLKPSIVLSASFLAKNAEKACTLLHKIFTDNNFDDISRVKELILSTNANLQSSMNSQALGLALKESTSSFNSYCMLKNHLSGLPYVQYIHKIAGDPSDSAMSSLSRDLNTLKQEILHFHEMDFVITCQKKHYESLVENAFYRLSTLKKRPFTPFTLIPKTKTAANQIHILPIAISHNALGLKSIGYQDPQSASLALASYCIKNKILHTEIREKGGAYGSGATYNPLSQTFAFYSYRDPNIARTHKMFKEACHICLKEGFSEQELLEAKLGFFSDNETSTPPSARAFSTYNNEVNGLNLASREKYKQQILGASIKDLLVAIEKHLLPHFQKSIFTCYTSKQAASQAKKELSITTQLLEPFA